MSHNSTEDIAALIGSRICHDLISPIGAVNNGLELLSLSGTPHSPELSLVSDSAASANARISLFRIAFGIAAEDQITRREDLCRIWSAAMQDRRLELVWSGPDSLTRPLAQALVLACLCLDKALPQGGTLNIREHRDIWNVTATGPSLKIEEELWTGLAQGEYTKDMEPSHVQFLLLPRCLVPLRRQCLVELGERAITLSF